MSVDGDYEPPRDGCESNFPTATTTAPLARLIDDFQSVEYTAPRRELTDTEIVDRMVSCMPTINVDRAMGAPGAKRNMLIQLTGNYDDIEGIRAQLLKRAAARPATAEVAIIDAEQLPPPSKRLPW